MEGTTSRGTTATVVGRNSAPPRKRVLASADGERGSVLLETAIALPVLLGVALALAWALSLGVTSMTLGDAARLAARDMARGVPTSQALAAAAAAAPDAALRVEDAGDLVTVIAEQEVSAPGPILGGLGVTLTQRVSVPREWS